MKNEIIVLEKGQSITFLGYTIKNSLNNDGEFTKGQWAIGYGDDSNTMAIVTKKMLDEGLFEHPICIISPIDKINDTDKANAQRIVKAVNNFDALKENLERILDRIEESNLQGNFPSAYKIAKEILNRVK